MTAALSDCQHDISAALDQVAVSVQEIEELSENEVSQDQIILDQVGPESTDPLMTSRQRRMLWSLETFGILGLAHCLCEVAQEEDKNDVQQRAMRDRAKLKRSCAPTETRKLKRRRTDDDIFVTSDGDLNQALASDELVCESDVDVNDQFQGHTVWERVVRDLRRGVDSIVLYYLASMPLPLIVALMRGNLPLMMQRSCFREEIGRYVKVKDTPGVYAVYVATNNLDVHHAGHGLSLRQLIEASETIRSYCNVELKGSAELAIKIDSLYGEASTGLDYAHERRYGCGTLHDDFQPHLVWLEKLDEMVLNWARSLLHTDQDCLLDRPLERSFVYIGQSKRVLARVFDHTVHRNASSLFGLLTAVLRYLYNDRFDTFDHSYQILHTARSDHIGLDEALVAMLSSGHWWDGGLNRGHTETTLGPHSVSEALQARLDTNAGYNDSSGYQNQNLTDAYRKVRNISESLGRMKANMPETRQSLTGDLHKLPLDNQQEKAEFSRLQALEELLDIERAVSSMDLTQATG